MRSAGCANAADYTGSPVPFHTIAIDDSNDFNRQAERFPAGSAKADAYTAYATWDDCRLYFGYQGTAFGSGASPYKYLVYYLDTDPLGDAGSKRAKTLAPNPPRLPFYADYLLEIRTDGRTIHTGDSTIYRGNVQLYRRTDKWSPGFVQSWEPIAGKNLTVGGSEASNFIEAALDRATLGDPCAVEVVGWVVDTKREARFGYWPAPPHPPGRAAAPDSLALNYYGFPFIRAAMPNASINLNRTDYSTVGDCARGDKMNQ